MAGYKLFAFSDGPADASLRGVPMTDDYPPEEVKLTDGVKTYRYVYDSKEEGYRYGGWRDGS